MREEVLEQLKSFLYILWPPWFPHLCSLSKLVLKDKKGGEKHLVGPGSQSQQQFYCGTWISPGYYQAYPVLLSSPTSLQDIPSQRANDFLLANSLALPLFLSSLLLYTRNHPLLSKSSTLSSQSFIAVLPGFSCCVPSSGRSPFL